MELPVIQVDGKPGKPLKVSENTFGAKFNEALIHQVVVAYQAGARAGTPSAEKSLRRARWRR